MTTAAALAKARSSSELPESTVDDWDTPLEVDLDDPGDEHDHDGDQVREGDDLDERERAWAASSFTVRAIRASSVRMEPVEWLWASRIPRGAITVLAGDPGLGKSLLACHLAARLSRGELTGEPGSALLATAEDSLASTLVPRLQAAGADLERVAFAEVWHGGFSEGLMLPDHVSELAATVRERGADLVVIDPLTAFLPANVNTWQDQSIRGALRPVHQLARDTNCAVLVIAHLNKSQTTDPLQRLGGSIGLPAAARSVLLLGRDPDDPEGESGSQRVLAQVKSNLSAPAPSLAYTLSTAHVGDQGEIETARLELRGESHHQGADLLAVSTALSGAAGAEAQSFLRTELAEGPRLASELKELAKARGLASITVRRAKEVLGIVSEKTGYNGGWLWSLPEDAAA